MNIVETYVHNNVWGYTEILPKRKLFSKKALAVPFVLGDGKTVEFTGKLLRIRTSRKQRDRCWPSIVLRPIREKHSNESWNWFVKSSIPGVVARSWKLSLPFITTRLTAPGSPRMVINSRHTHRKHSRHLNRDSRLLTVLYFSVRSSRSRALRYGLPILHECQNYRATIPDFRPLDTFENQDSDLTKK